MPMTCTKQIFVSFPPLFSKRLEWLTCQNNVSCAREWNKFVFLLYLTVLLKCHLPFSNLCLGMFFKPFIISSFFWCVPFGLQKYIILALWLNIWCTPPYESLTLLKLKIPCQKLELCYNEHSKPFFTLNLEVKLHDTQMYKMT